MGSGPFPPPPPFATLSYGKGLPICHLNMNLKWWLPYWYNNNKVGFHSFDMFFNQYFSFINYMVIYRKSQIILNTGNIHGVLLSLTYKANPA